MLPIARLIKIRIVSNKFRFIKEKLVTFRTGRKQDGMTHTAFNGLSAGRVWVVSYSGQNSQNKMKSSAQRSVGFLKCPAGRFKPWKPRFLPCRPAQHPPARRREQPAAARADGATGEIKRKLLAEAGSKIPAFYLTKSSWQFSGEA
jgi:hypothetical protein